LAQASLTAPTWTKHIIFWFAFDFMWRNLSALLCAVALLATGARSHERHGRLISIPDLHGDYERTVQILGAAGLVDPETLAWSGGNATLVQTGDIVDRGNDGKKIYELFFRLADEASLAGGRVINLLGNHELMNIQEDLRYVSPGDVASFGGWDQRAEAWGPAGWLGKRVRRFPVAARVANVLFVHAGVSDQVLDRVGGLDDVVEETAAAIANDGQPSNSKGRLLLGNEGPVWTRRYAEGDSACRTASSVLERVGATRMVIGHTIQDEVHPVCGGDVVLADTAISRAYGGEMNFLEHRMDGTAVAMYPRTGTKQQLVQPQHRAAHLRSPSALYEY